MSEQGKEGVVFVELGHFNKHFIKNTRNRGPAGNILKFFLLDTLKTTFSMKNLPQRWTQPGPFFPKSGHFFRFSKRIGEASPLPPLVPRLWVWLNMHQYCWIFLNTFEKYLKELFWLCQALNMHDHLTCSTGF